MEKKQIDRAIEILWEMESSGEDEGPQPDLATYLCVAGGLAAAGDAKRLEAVLAKMPRGTKLPENVKSDLVVEALCISGDVDAAEELARGQPWRSEETVGTRYPDACACVPSLRANPGALSYANRFARCQ